MPRQSDGCRARRVLAVTPSRGWRHEGASLARGTRTNPRRCASGCGTTSEPPAMAQDVDVERPRPPAGARAPTGLTLEPFHQPQECCGRYGARDREDRISIRGLSYLAERGTVYDRRNRDYSQTGVLHCGNCVPEAFHRVAPGSGNVSPQSQPGHVSTRNEPRLPFRIGVSPSQGVLLCAENTNGQPFD
jgi:hypothetical protein